MSEFTKGPWKIDRDFHFIGQDAGTVAISSTVYGEWRDLARVVVRMEDDKYDCADGLANANLIASAPDMYEALVKAESLFQKGLLNATTEEIDEVRDLRKAALAKARGE